MLKLKSSKSPLRYPGGKSRGAEKIFKYVTKETKEICSPFFGGGSVELLCANNGIKVRGYDKFLPLVDFWKSLLNNPKKLGSSCSWLVVHGATRTFKKNPLQGFAKRSHITRSDSH